MATLQDRMDDALYEEVETQCERCIFAKLNTKKGLTELPFICDVGLIITPTVFIGDKTCKTKRTAL